MNVIWEFIVKLFRPNYSKKVSKNKSIFTKAYDKAAQLRDEMSEDIKDKEEEMKKKEEKLKKELAKISARINDIEQSRTENAEFLHNLEKFL